MRQALIFINALIIAITKIIRAFVPMSTEAANAAASMKQYADDTEDAADATENQGKNLDIDEFRALNSSDDSQLSITEQITAELERQAALYQQYIDSLGTISNKATEIAEKIKNWFIVTDGEGKFVEWTNQAKGLAAAIGAISVLKFASYLNQINESTEKLTNSQKLLQTIFSKNTLIIAAIAALFAYAYTTNEEFRNGINSLAQSLLELISVLVDVAVPLLNGIVSIITPIINVIAPLVGSLASLISVIIDLLNQTGLLHILLVTIIGVVTAKKISSALSSLNSLIPKTTNLLGSLQKVSLSTQLSILGIGAAIGGLIGSYLTTLPTEIKAVVGALSLLIGVALAAALAVGALQSAWSLGIAAAAITAGIIAITSAINDAKSTANSVQGFANGGITNANLIMTHENGTREWVGKQGSSTAVVNDSQMSDVMSRSVRNGVLEALSYNTGSEEFTVIVQANLDGEKVYQTTRKVARRHGEKFIKV